MASEEITLQGMPTPLPVPRFALNSFTMLGTPLELILLCSTNTPSHDPSGNVGLASVPVATISMPATVAKELAILLDNYVKEVEASSGELKSEFITANSAS